MALIAPPIRVLFGATFVSMAAKPSGSPGMKHSPPGVEILGVLDNICGEIKELSGVTHGISNRIGVVEERLDSLERHPPSPRGGHFVGDDPVSARGRSHDQNGNTIGEINRPSPVNPGAAGPSVQATRERLSRFVNPTFAGANGRQDPMQSQ